MVLKLEDIRALEAVPAAITGDDNNSMEDFLRSLSLDSDEETAIREWMDKLPTLSQDPGSLPDRPPKVKGFDWWA